MPRGRGAKFRVPPPTPVLSSGYYGRPNAVAYDASGENEGLVLGTLAIDGQCCVPGEDLEVAVRVEDRD